MTEDFFLSQNKEELLKGIRNAEKEYLKLFEKYENTDKVKAKRKFDALYSCFGLYGDCIESSHKTKLHHVIPIVTELREDLTEEGLSILRRLHKQVEDVLRHGKTFDDGMNDFFPNSKLISSEPVDR